MAVTREEMFFNHTTKYKRGTVEPWMLYQRNNKVQGFEMPHAFAKILDANSYYDIPTKYKQMLQMHSTKYKHGKVTPEMLYRPKAKYDEFEMPQAFASSMDVPDDVEVPEELSLKQKIEQMIQRKTRPKNAQQTAHKHPIKDFVEKLTNRA